MTRRFVSSLLGSVALLGGATASRVANAQDAPAAAAKHVSAADVARARKLFDAGVRFSEQGDDLAALAAFEQAYAVAPRPNLLFSQALAHKKLYAATANPAYRTRSIELYRAFLAEAANGPEKAKAVAALEELTALEVEAASTAASPDSTGAPAPGTIAIQRKTMLAIDSPIQAALISVDGGAAAPPQVKVEVSPGKHAVRVSAPGYVSRELTLEALPGQITPERVTLEELPGRIELSGVENGAVYVDGRLFGSVRSLTLRPGRHFVSITSNGHESVGRWFEVRRGESRRLSFDAETSSQRTAAVVTLGAGAVGVAGALIFMGLALDRDAEASEIDRKRKTGWIEATEQAKYESSKSERDTFRTAAIVSGSAGAAAAALGLVLYLVDHGDPLPLGEQQPARGDKSPRAGSLELSVLPSAAPEGVLAWASGRF